MLKSEAAAYLAGVTQTEGAEASAPTNLHVITGEVGEASADGKTLVKIDGLMFSESDDQFIEVDALGGLEEGDIATIVLTGEQGHAMTPLALGSIGSVDRITVRIAAIEADYIKVEQLDAATARIGELEADHVSVDDLDAATARIGTLETTRATITDLEAATARIGDLEADHVSTDDLDAATARIGTLETNTADIGTIRANSAKVQNLTAAELEADHAAIEALDSNYAHITNGVIDNATIGYADVNNLSAHYAEIQNGKINSALIDTAAIVDEQVFTVTGNKATISQLNADHINVRSINVKDLTVETANGYVNVGGKQTPTKELLDSIKDELQQEIDGAVETFTSSAVPLLNNYPASEWVISGATAEEQRKAYAKHVGDICYVQNSALDQNGYAYRFAYDSTEQTFKWVLIKDSDVTKALGDISDLKTFESDTTTWMEETDEGLTTIRQNHTALSGVVDKTVVETKQLWFTKSNTTAPNKPTTQVTSTSTAGNAWRVVVPAYNASYPNYYYCLQYKLADGTYAWSDVVRDIAMGESQQQGRKGVADAATADGKAVAAQTAADGAAAAAATADGKAVSAQTTANANIKSSVQLWFTKANTTAPSKPSGTSPISVNDASKTNQWNLAIPTYNASYPNYFYCYQQQKGDGTWQWTDVVYDRSITEAQAKAQAALPSSEFNTFKTTTFKEVVDEVDEQSSTISTLSETVSTKADQSTVTTLSNTVNSVKQTADTNKASITSLTQTVNNKADGSTVTTLTQRTSTIEQNLNGITTRVSATESSISGHPDCWRIDRYSRPARVNTNNVVPVPDDFVEENFLDTRYRKESDMGTNLQIADYYIAKLTTYVHATEATTITDNFQHDDASAVYLNDEHIAEAAGTTVISVTLNLRAGWNKIRFLLNEQTGSDYARFATRISTWSNVDQQVADLNEYEGTIQEQRLSSAETSIEQNAEAITLRATKTEVQQVRPAYASSSTAAGTAAKVATIDPAVTGYALYKGASVAVTFSTANTAATPTLNLNSTGAKQIRSYTGAALSEAEYKWAAGATIDLVYDGTYWRMQDSGAVKRVTAAEASIRVNADNIESKVSKDGVISSINQSAETVKIQASKVEIDGTAIFTAISSDVDDAITSKGYQTSSQVNSAIASKGYATTTQAQGYASTAKSEAISAAATDAATKASNTLASAKSYADAIKQTVSDWVLDPMFSTGADKFAGVVLNATAPATLPTGCTSCGMLTTRDHASGIQHYGKAGHKLRVHYWCYCVPDSGSTVSPSKMGVGFLAPTANNYADVVKTSASGKWFEFSAVKIVPTNTTSGWAKLFIQQETASGTTNTGRWYITGLTVEDITESAAAMDVANAAAPKANAVKRTQRIWYRTNASSAPATPGTASSNWVTKADDGNDAWTKMHIAINSTHKHIYTCEQYEMANGTVGYTSVLLDNTITVIDGGNIITGSVTANKLDAANINASKTLTVGAMTDAAASTILNSNVVVGGRNLLLSEPSSFKQTSYDTYAIPSSTSAKELGAGTTLTIQFWDVVLDANSSGIGGYWGGSSSGQLFLVKPDADGYCSVTFTIPTGTASHAQGANKWLCLYNLANGHSGMSLSIGKWKLEKGNKATDWSPAPEDMATAESLAGTNESLEGAITDIGELSDQLVGTVSEQNKTITDIQKYLNSLRQDLDAEIQSRQQWLNFNSAEGLIIGATGSTFKTVTTNTSQQFRSGGTILAETSGTEFVAPVMRSDQLLIGNWMWTRRDNGNLSLKWIG